MKTFITNLLSNSNDASHKRVIALISFLVLIAMVVIKALGYQLDNSLIYVFAAMAGGESVLTVIEKFIK
jgi:hypothetical protein